MWVYLKVTPCRGDMLHGVHVQFQGIRVVHLRCLVDVSWILKVIFGQNTLFFFWGGNFWRWPVADSLVIVFDRSFLVQSWQPLTFTPLPTTWAESLQGLPTMAVDQAEATWSDQISDLCRGTPTLLKSTFMLSSLVIRALGCASRMVVATCVPPLVDEGITSVPAASVQFWILAAKPAKLGRRLSPVQSRANLMSESAKCSGHWCSTCAFATTKVCGGPWAVSPRVNSSKKMMPEHNACRPKSWALVPTRPPQSWRWRFQTAQPCRSLQP